MMPSSHTAPFSNAFGNAHEQTSPLLGEKASGSPAATSVNKPTLTGPPQTRDGSDILEIFGRACDWATSERHAVVTIDHLLFAMTVCPVGASALTSSGVTGVGDLEVELLNVVHKMPVDALAENEALSVDKAVLAVLGHALGYARHHDRDESNVSDLLAALLNSLKETSNSPGIELLRKHWLKATELDGISKLLTQIRDAQANQPAMIAKILAEELAMLRERIATLEESKEPKSLDQSAGWHRRLNGLFVFAGMLAISTGVGVWILAA